MNGVAGTGYFVVEALDLFEGGLKTVLGEKIRDRVSYGDGWAYPLRLELISAFGFGDGVFEDAVIGP